MLEGGFIVEAAAVSFRERAARRLERATMTPQAARFLQPSSPVHDEFACGRRFRILDIVDD
jgi:hypothetical protein